MSKTTTGRRLPGSARGLFPGAVLLLICFLLAACGDPATPPAPGAGAAVSTPAPQAQTGGAAAQPQVRPTLPAVTPATTTGPGNQGPTPGPVEPPPDPEAAPPDPGGPAPGPEAADPPEPESAGPPQVQAPESPPESCSTDVPTPCEFAARKVEVHSAGGRVAELSVEIADSPELRSRGLMFRSTLAENAGMLFEYDGDTSGGFWMRNTYIGLDIAFLDADGVVLAVLPGEPESLETVSPGQPFRYVLEVNRGWFMRMGFGPGDRVTVGGVPAPVAPLPTPVPTAIPIAAGAAALLNELNVLPEHDSGYDRGDWPHWSDLDRDGCDTRCEVLAAEQLPDGSWYSVFDGRSTTVAREFDIDHLVPLAEAHESGGWEWDRSTRQLFANDETYAHSLIAVSASSNRSKGKKDPAEWLPPDSDSHCFYADAWVRIKHRWSLSVDVNELIALGRILTDCPTAGTIPAAPAVPAPPAAPTQPPAAPTQPPETEPDHDVEGGESLAIASCDAAGELVEIVGPAGFELAGWTISDEGSRNVHSFATGTAVPESGVLVIASGRASGDLKPWGGRNVWNNDGDTVTLQGPDAARISLACT